MLNVNEFFNFKQWVAGGMCHIRYRDMTPEICLLALRATAWNLALARRWIMDDFRRRKLHDYGDGYGLRHYSRYHMRKSIASYRASHLQYLELCSYYTTLISKQTPIDMGEHAVDANQRVLQIFNQRFGRPAGNRIAPYTGPNPWFVEMDIDGQTVRSRPLADEATATRAAFAANLQYGNVCVVDPSGKRVPAMELPTKWEE